MKNNYSFVINLAKLDYYKYLENSALLAPIKYILENPGKNLRPSLLLAACDYFQINLLTVKNLALSLELVHTYSLIHDDLPCMDNDDYRRGKLTLHKKYDEGTATLVGDALLSDAFTFLSFALIPDYAKVNLVCNLSQAIGSIGMVEGQKIDLDCKTKDIEQLISMFIKKTGELFAYALVTPIIIKKRGSINDWKELGKLLGVCFQLRDDIDEYKNNKKVSYLIKLIGILKVKQLYEEYQKLVDEKIEILRINKNSDLYEIIMIIRG